MLLQGLYTQGDTAFDFSGFLKVKAIGNKTRNNVFEESMENNRISTRACYKVHHGRLVHRHFLGPIQVPVGKNS